MFKYNQLIYLVRINLHNLHKGFVSTQVSNLTNEKFCRTRQYKVRLRENYRMPLSMVLLIWRIMRTLSFLKINYKTTVWGVLDSNHMKRLTRTDQRILRLHRVPTKGDKGSDEDSDVTGVDVVDGKQLGPFHKEKPQSSS